MTPVYEVKTKHTQKVLEDFITFTYKIKYPRVTMNLVILSMCFLAFAYVVRGGTGMYVFAVLAAVVFLFAMLRKKIGVSKLKKVDVNYQKQSEIHLIFGESEFIVENPDMDQNDHVKYGEISYIYGDDVYYYISINNEDLQMLPKTDFTLGDQAAFYDFIMDKTKKPVRPVHIPWKMRFKLMMEYRDIRAEEMKKRQQEKTKKKK